MKKLLLTSILGLSSVACAVTFDTSAATNANLLVTMSADQDWSDVKATFQNHKESDMDELPSIEPWAMVVRNTSGQVVTGIAVRWESSEGLLVGSFHYNGSLEPGQQWMLLPMPGSIGAFGDGIIRVRPLKKTHPFWERAKVGIIDAISFADGTVAGPNKSGYISDKEGHLDLDTDKFFKRPDLYKYLPNRYKKYTLESRWSPEAIVPGAVLAWTCYSNPTSSNGPCISFSNSAPGSGFSASASEIIGYCSNNYNAVTTAFAYNSCTIGPTNTSTYSYNNVFNVTSKGTATTLLASISSSVTQDCQGVTTGGSWAVGLCPPGPPMPPNPIPAPIPTPLPPPPIAQIPGPCEVAGLFPFGYGGGVDGYSWYVAYGTLGSWNSYGSSFNPYDGPPQPCYGGGGGDTTSDPQLEAPPF